MRIAHLSDTHLGLRELHHTDAEGRNVREQDVYRVFARAIDKILELEPTAVVHSGDLFHGHHPTAAALGVALDQIERLRAAGIGFVVIAGNHETPRVRAITHPFALLERFGADAVHGQPRRLRFGELGVTAIPHSLDREEMAGLDRGRGPRPGGPATTSWSRTSGSKGWRGSGPVSRGRSSCRERSSSRWRASTTSPWDTFTSSTGRGSTPSTRAHRTG